MTAASLADGRSARAARTRDAVVDALLALLADGNLRPTAREIADRAGVSLRSVYVHFDDLEDLFTAAAGRHFEHMLELLTPVPIEGPLAVRLDALVEQRCRLMEAGAPVRRAALLQEPFSPTLAKVMRLGRKAGREQLERVFEPELATERGDSRRRLLAALDIATNSDTWEHLRSHEGLSPEESRTVVTELVTGVLAGRNG